jgi:hypothetical protein
MKMQGLYGQSNQAIPGGIRYAEEADTKIRSAQEPAILAEMNELEKNLHRLHETIGMLESRLSSVLCPAPDESNMAGLGRDHRGASPMLHSLANLSGMVDAAGARVRRIMDGLEL